jgi:hypothetical protein
VTAGEFDETEEIRDRSGEVVAGRYRLDAILGRGGMGYVYRAQHLELDEPVVVKFIDPAFAQDPVARTRFRREAKALIRLRHPGIVTMRELGEHDGALFLVMELLEGRTLGARIASQSGGLSLDEAYEIFRQLGEVLEAVHAAGVVHRDLKPDNVMLVPHRVPSASGIERAVLMDFGVARVEMGREAGVSTTGAVLGTPSYMSPEQCAGRPAGPASDLYSLGVMLFLSLAGRLPFESETPTVLMSHHMFVAAPKLASTAAGQPISPGLAKLVDDLLGKKPETRPTATELVQRLEAARTGWDPLTFGAASAERRLADVLKTRQERAIPTAPTARGGLGDDLAVQPTMLAWGPNQVEPRAWLRGFSRERASVVVASLAVNGIAGADVDAMAAPPPASDEVVVVILSGAGTKPAAESVRELRQQPSGEKLPILVIDVGDANEIADLIRAGASDVALAVLGDDAVAAKAWRLIRRKR